MELMLEWLKGYSTLSRATRVRTEVAECHAVGLWAVSCSSRAYDSRSTVKKTTTGGLEPTISHATVAEGLGGAKGGKELREGSLSEGEAERREKITEGRS